MNIYFLQFESLPNEILIQIFEYFNAQELFQSFYNLNYRFNNLLQSYNNLSLSFHISNINNINLIPYINTLIIYNQIQINLNSFYKIRRLFLIQSHHNILKQLQINHFPYIEQLFIRSINKTDINFMSDLSNKIFSNQFLNLKICSFYQMNLLIQTSSWTKLLSLRILKIGDIDQLIYQSILLFCPNLYLFKFTKIQKTYEKLSNTNIINQHKNLKKLIIIYPWFELLSLDNNDLNYYFLFVPYLEQLTIHQTNESNYINDIYLKFDWFKSLIKLYLPLLNYFTYYLHILKSQYKISFQIENILKQITEYFHQIHKDLKHRFILDI